MTEVAGSCLCGAVRFSAQGPLRPVSYCHCSQCRRQSGHYLVAVNIRRSALEIQGEDRVAWYRSSDKVERGFCSVCGSSLFWKPLIEGYEFTAGAMGLFELPTATRISKHTFVGDKGDYYDISDEIPQSTGF